MRALHFTLLVVSISVASAAKEIRCQCSTDKSGIPCMKEWCRVQNNATHIGACAVVVHGTAQYLACARVKEESANGSCATEIRNGVDVTKCWCTGSDYCNLDLVDRIDSNNERDLDESDEMTIEAVEEYDENSGPASEENMFIRQVTATEQSNVIDMRKPPETRATHPAEELSVWRRQNALNSDTVWKPPPPPPMPGQGPATVSTSSTPPTTTTTTTQRTTPMSYEEHRRQYEEKRRLMELEREQEMRRREEMEKQRAEERRRLELQYESRKRFRGENPSWPVPDPVPALKTTTSTTATTTTTTTTSTTTTTEPTTPTTITTATTPTTTTRSIQTPIVTAAAKKETKTNFEKYYRNWQPHRRPFDLNPTQKSIAITNFNAIVYPPKNFVKAKSTTVTTVTPTTVPMTVPTTSPTTTTTTTTTTAAPITTTTAVTTDPPTTTTPIMYPPANFKIATKPPVATTPDDYPPGDTEDYDDDEYEEEERKNAQEFAREKTDKMTEVHQVFVQPEHNSSQLPTSEEFYEEEEEYEEEDAVALFTPPPRKNPEPVRVPPTPSVRTPVDKMDEYKKLVGSSSCVSALASILFISLIFLF